MLQKVIYIGWFYFDNFAKICQLSFIKSDLQYIVDDSQYVAPSFR